jgi:hypothetical protein
VRFNILSLFINLLLSTISSFLESVYILYVFIFKNLKYKHTFSIYQPVYYHLQALPHPLMPALANTHQPCFSFSLMLRAFFLPLFIKTFFLSASSLLSKEWIYLLELNRVSAFKSIIEAMNLSITSKEINFLIYRYLQEAGFLNCTFFVNFMSYAVFIFFL